MRLIDADKIKLPQGFFEKVDNVPKFYEWLDEQPTVDAVPTDFHDRCMQIEIEKRFGMEEVVRCKDCKYFDHDDFGKGEEYWCKHFVSTDDTSHCHKVIEDDFCAWGERREDAVD